MFNSIFLQGKKFYHNHLQENNCQEAKEDYVYYHHHEQL